MLHPATPSHSANQEKASGSGLKTHTEEGNPPNAAGESDPGQRTSLSSGRDPHYSSSGNAVAHDRDARRIVRTIPAWVHTLDEDNEDIAEAAHSLLDVPPELRIAQHNTTPSPIFQRRHRPGSEPCRIYDSQREWTSPLPTSHPTESRSRWRAFADASAYPHISAEGGEIVTEEWLQQNGADYSRPWLEGDGDGEGEKGLAGIYRSRAKRRAWYIRVQRTILRSPVIPLLIRMNVWTYSAVALALAGSIHHYTDRAAGISQTPSTDMAIIVDAVAMVYLLYITWDEYSGKPLGLRPAKAKMRLIFLDLFFIVFDSANLSLAFEALRNRSSCAIPDRPENRDLLDLNPDLICERQRALASVLLVALIAWCFTFAISVLR